MHKVIFHVDEVNKWSLTLGNVKNLVKEFNRLNEKFEIIVLANSEAVKSYLDLTLIKEVKLISSKDITFKACNNALKAFKINKDLLIDEVIVVPTGVYELTIRQNKDNFAYIRP